MPEVRDRLWSSLIFNLKAFPSEVGDGPPVLANFSVQVNKLHFTSEGGLVLREEQEKVKE